MSDLSARRWRQIESILDQVLELEPAQRAAFVTEACGDDDALRSEVEALLYADEEGHAVLDESLGDFATALLQPTADESPGELPAGTRLGAYEIVDLIGAGGMGEVYRAKDLKLERDVAVKVLPSDLAADAERLRRFEHEAHAASALNHPNIVTIHDIGEEEGIHYIAMEYVEGKTLREILSDGELPTAQLLQLASQMAAGLGKAHGAGIVHRDLKPENVMVSDDGFVKILDFGLAKLRAPGAPREEQTATGVILGTVSYMSPEQVRGEEIDARSDLFSLGAVIYEMAAGHHPFGDRTGSELISTILRDEPRPLGELRPDAPADLDRIVRHCLQKQPERRFQTALGVRNELDELTSGDHERAARGPLSRAQPTAARRPRARRHLALAGAAALALVVIVVGVLSHRRSDPERLPIAEPAYPRTALAVLPFQNLSTDSEHAYFARGLHDELQTQLSRVAALSLRGRTSVMGYADTTKPIRQIGKELQVGALLEGSVQVVGGRLRVNVQLIDAATDEHLWAASYDRTLDDAFAIQSDVAQRVVAAVGAAVDSGERQAMAEAPTADAEAYRLYLQGLEYSRRPGSPRQNLEIAQQLYERALELDRELALAYVALSRVHGRMHWDRYDPSPARVAAQRDAAEAALRLAPELPQARMALGQWHYHGRRDWAAALEQYEIARQGLPNDAELVARIGYAHRRLGNWDEVYAAFERAAELNPRDARVFRDLGGNTYHFTRRYADAVRAFDRALELAPDFHEAAVAKAWTYVVWQGELGRLRAALDGIPGDTDLGGQLGSAVAQRAKLLFWERDAVNLLAHLESIRPDVLESQDFFVPKSLYAAWARELRGDLTAARVAFGAALQRFDAVPQDLEDDWRVRAARGLALAGLGSREEALREARWLEQSIIYRDDALSGQLLARNRAWILAWAGGAEAALDETERLLSGPSFDSVHTLRLDPRFDPLRDHSRFQELLVQYAKP